MSATDASLERDDPARKVAGGSLVAPTLIFGFFLLSSAAAGLLVSSGLRTYRLAAGWTASATFAVVAAVGFGAAVGALIGAVRAGRTIYPAGTLAAWQAAFGLAAFAAVPLYWVAQSGYLALWPLVGGSALGAWILRHLLALALFFPPSLCFFTLQPLMSRLIVPQNRGAAIGIGFSAGLGLTGLALGLGAGGTLILEALGTRGTFILGLALSGVAAAGTLLVRQCGLEGEGCVGTALAGSAASGGERRVDPDDGGGWFTVGVQFAAGMVLFGFVGWAYLVGWSRSLRFIIGDTLPGRAITAAVFLICLGLGAFLAAGLVDRIRTPCLYLTSVVGASSIAAYLSMYFIPDAVFLYYRLIPDSANPGLTYLPALLTVALVILPAGLLLGAALPVLPMAAGARQRPVIGAASLIAFGAVLADGMVALVVIPSFGLRRALSLAAAIGLLSAILFLGGVSFKKPTYRTTVALTLLVLMVILGSTAASWDPRIVGSGLYRYGPLLRSRFDTAERFRAARLGAEVPFYREGPNGSVMIELAYEGAPGLLPTESLALSIDGNVGASTGPDIRAQVLLGHLPVLLHGPTEKVLLVDFLDGIAAGSILRHPVKSLTVIEEEPVLFDASSAFSSYNHSPMQDRRLRTIVDGARSRLLTDQTLYDVIILGSMDPWRPSQASRLTIEGFELIRSRIHPDGVVAQRLRLGATTRPALESIMRTFARVFDSVLLFQITHDDLLMVGSIEPLALDIGWFRNVIGSNNEVVQDLRRVTVIGPSELVLTYRLDGSGLRELLGETPINSDDHSPVEFATARNLMIHDGTPVLQSINAAWPGLLPVIKNYGALPQDRAEFLYSLAKSYLGIAGDTIRASDIAGELSGMGQTAMARWVNGESLLQQRDVDGALEEWRGVLDLEPDNLDALFSLGTYYLDGRDYWQAEPYLARAAGRHGDTAVVRYHYGRTLYSLEKYREAIDELKNAREFARETEKYPLIDYLIGVSALALERLDESEEALKTYLEWAYTQSNLTRLEVDAHLKLADVYDARGRRFDAHRERQKGEKLRRNILEYARTRGGANAGPVPGIPVGPEDPTPEIDEPLSDLP